LERERLRLLLRLRPCRCELGAATAPMTRGADMLVTSFEGCGDR
jgi:hypothetical protein